MSESYTPNFDLEDFAYDLPQELIAQTPSEVRHESRLMFLKRQGGTIADHEFHELPTLLQRGDVLVINDTKVIPARLLARRESGGQVEILLLRPEAQKPGLWHAMATPLRKLKPGEKLIVEVGGKDVGTVSIADIIEAEDGQRRALIDFGSQANVYALLSQEGYAPLPPYIRRQRDDESQQALRETDLARYQTIFARAPGAVAAPTAGLHFSETVFDQLRWNGIEVHRITLHVGPGTFKPISTSLDEHTIESEEFSIDTRVATALNKAREENRRIIAVGTTSCRALETAGASGMIEAVESQRTSLYIRPGYQFKVISGLITNFHLSKSSLLVLVSAFAGHELIMRAYKTAVDKRYRFFSYGDAMLIL